MLAHLRGGIALGVAPGGVGARGGLGGRGRIGYAREMMPPALDRRALLLGGGALLAGCGARPAAPRAGFSLADLKQRTFRFFWERTNPRNGLTPDRWPTPSFSSIAAVGFALTAYGVGEHRGWISRAAHRARALATLRFFEGAPQGPELQGNSGYRGFFYHFLDMETGRRFGRTELSTVDTTLLLAGILFSATWFDRNHPEEEEVRRLADAIYARVEWDWILPRAPFVAMGWHPETGFIASDWDYFNEAHLLYILALGSPTHALPASTWDAWTSSFDRAWGASWGAPHIQFPALFIHQYSQVWLDLRGVRDAYARRRDIDYFENSRRATVAQRNYAIHNPGGWAGYGGEVWGLTACDGPGDFTLDIAGRRRQFFSYSERGPGSRDDGTLAPTALGGSIPFAPEVTVPALAAIHRRYGSAVYGRYGFLDAFNPTLTRAPELKHGRLVPEMGWVADDYLGIDQGPILTMLENHDSGLVWRVMRRNPHVRRSLLRAGFTGGWLQQQG